MPIPNPLRQRIKPLLRILLGKEAQGTLKAQMARGVSGTFALKVASVGLAFVTSLILARILGAKGYGIYAYAISWVSLLSVPVVMGLPTLLIREVARYRTKSDWNSLRGILRWSDRLVLAVSLGLALLASIVIWLFQGPLEPQIRTALWIAMIILPFLAFTRIRRGSIQGLGHVVEAQLPLLLILPVLFLILVSILFFAVGLSAPLAVGMRALAAAVAFFLGASLLKKYLPKSVQEVPPNYHAREWFRSVFPLLFVGAAGMINQQISVIMVGSMVGPEAAGIFDVARRGAMLVTFVLMAVNMPLAPTVAGLYARGKMERLQRVVTKSARVVLLGSLPIAVGLIIFGHWVLLLFGKEFTGGSNALAILSLGQLVNAGMGSVGLLLNMSGYERDTVKGMAIAAVVNIMLGLALIPFWGIIGAAVATAGSMALWNILLWWRVRKRLQINSLAFNIQLGGYR